MKKVARIAIGVGPIILITGVQDKLNTEVENTKTPRTKHQKEREKILQNVRTHEMVKAVPFLTEEEIINAFETRKSQKLDKKSRVPSIDEKKLKERMHALSNFLDNNDVSSLPEDKIAEVKEKKFGSVFHSLAKDTAEWHTGIRRLAKRYMRN
ncbi:MAG: hypothetical protein WAV23_03380 [Minisyncoccia bacterium]